MRTRRAWAPHAPRTGTQNAPALWKTVWQFPEKVKHKLAVGPGNLAPGNLPHRYKKIRPHKDLYVTIRSRAHSPEAERTHLPNN